MQIQRWTGAGVLAFSVAALLLGSGCTRVDRPTKSGTTAAAQSGHTHDDWWCAEHGIPEDECSMCSKKVADACKAKGDWCKQHDRAKSQCFICDPKLKEVYAAKYRAKYGKEPPPIEEEAPTKDETKKDDKS